MIISCGEALIDFVPQKGNDIIYKPCPGGSPYNLAIAAARLAVPTGFLSKISRDFFGDMLYKRLESEGVNLSYTKRSDRLSTLAFVQIADGEEPRYAFYTENTADRNLVPVDVPGRFPDEVACLEFGSISLLLEPQASTIKNLIRRESGKRAISFDPNVRDMMIGDRSAFVKDSEELAGLSTIVKVSAADLEWMYPGRSAEESAASWLSKGAGIVVLTRGKDGGVVLAPNFRVEAPEYWVKVKDTIGAGDTFHAAFLARLYQLGRLKPNLATELSREEAQDALDYAVKASSLNCAREGADPPTAAEMAAAK